MERSVAARQETWEIALEVDSCGLAVRLAFLSIVEAHGGEALEGDRHFVNTIPVSSTTLGPMSHLASSDALCALELELSGRIAALEARLGRFYETPKVNDGENETLARRGSGSPATSRAASLSRPSDSTRAARPSSCASESSCGPSPPAP